LFTNYTNRDVKRKDREGWEAVLPRRVRLVSPKKICLKGEILDTIGKEDGGKA
jgi:hypothetical protein